MALRSFRQGTPSTIHSCYTDLRYRSLGYCGPSFWPFVISAGANGHRKLALRKCGAGGIGSMEQCSRSLCEPGLRLHHGSARVPRRAASIFEPMVWANLSDAGALLLMAAFGERSWAKRHPGNNEEWQMSPTGGGLGPSSFTSRFVPSCNMHGRVSLPFARAEAGRVYPPTCVEHRGQTQWISQVWPEIAKIKIRAMGKQPEQDHPSWARGHIPKVASASTCARTALPRLVCRRLPEGGIC